MLQRLGGARTAMTRLLLRHGSGLLAQGAAPPHLLLALLLEHSILLLLLLDERVVRGLVGITALDARTLAKVVVGVIAAIVTRVEQVSADLRLVLGDQLVKLEEDLQRALLL